MSSPLPPPKKPPTPCSQDGIFSKAIPAAIGVGVATVLVYGGGQLMFGEPGN